MGCGKRVKFEEKGKMRNFWKENGIIVGIAVLFTVTLIYFVYHVATSNPIVEQFKLVSDSLHVRSTRTMQDNESLHDKFSPILSDSSKNEFADAYLSINKVTDHIVTYTDSLALLLEKREAKDYEYVNQLMLTQGHGTFVKELIVDARNTMLGLSVWNDADTSYLANRMNLTVQYNEKNAKKLNKKNWEEYHFDHVPAIAVITLLNKFKNDALSSQGLVLERLYEKATINP